MQIDMDALPHDAITYIAQLRRECAKTRVQRNKVRSDLDKAIDRIRDLHAKLDALRAQADV
jgi:septal ring factor EnvC (AmiA/AmiB activator)